MWRLRVVHTTGYAYQSAVTASYNEARLTPRSDTRQNVILNRVETIPATRSYRYIDYWGTAVTAFDLHAPHTDLTVTSSSVVETEQPEPPAKDVSWRRPAVRGSDRSVRRIAAPHRVHPGEQAVCDPSAGRSPKTMSPQEAVVAAAKWVHGELDYLPGTTGVHSSGLDALNEGKGVCQDFVHLSLMLLRGMGIPARYVSGYLHPKRNAVVGETVDGRSHAWIQAWTGGWWNYDPTNDTEITEQYVSVGVGRDYTDVSPLKGIYSGRGRNRSRRGRGGHPAGLARLSFRRWSSLPRSSRRRYRCRSTPRRPPPDCASSGATGPLRRSRWPRGTAGGGRVGPDRRCWAGRCRDPKSARTPHWFGRSTSWCFWSADPAHIVALGLLVAGMALPSLDPRTDAATVWPGPAWRSPPSPK